MPTNPNQPNPNDPNKNRPQIDPRAPQDQPAKKDSDVEKEPMRQPGQPGREPDPRERKGQF